MRSKKIPARRFPLDEVLSVAVDRNLCGMAHLRRFLSFVLGDDVAVGLTDVAIRQCRPYILSLFPELAQAGTPEHLAELFGLVLGAQRWNKPAEEAAGFWVDRMYQVCCCRERTGYLVPPMPKNWRARR